MFSILVLQCGLQPDYVLDKIEWYEINALLKYSYYKYKDGWEQSRLIAYMIAQTNSTQKLTVDDIMHFYWEEERKEEQKPITKEDIIRLSKMAHNYLNKKENGAN